MWTVMVPVSGEGSRLSPPDQTRPFMPKYMVGIGSNRCQHQRSTFNVQPLTGLGCEEISQCPVGHHHFLLFVPFLRPLGRLTRVGMEKLGERAFLLSPPSTKRKAGRDAKRRCWYRRDQCGKSLHRATLLIYDLFSSGVGGKGNDGESPPCYRNSWFTREGPS